MDTLQLHWPGRSSDTPPMPPLHGLHPCSSAAFGHSPSDVHLTCSVTSFSFLLKCSPFREVFSDHFNKNGTTYHALVFSLALPLRDIIQRTLMMCPFCICEFTYSLKCIVIPKSTLRLFSWSSVDMSRVAEKVSCPTYMFSAEETLFPLLVLTLQAVVLSVVFFLCVMVLVIFVLSCSGSTI